MQKQISNGAMLSIRENSDAKHFRLSKGVYVVKKFVNTISHAGDFHACVALKFMPNAAAARYHETFASFFRPCTGTTMSNLLFLPPERSCGKP